VFRTTQCLSVPKITQNCLGILKMWIVKPSCPCISLYIHHDMGMTWALYAVYHCAVVSIISVFNCRLLEGSTAVSHLITDTSCVCGVCVNVRKWWPLRRHYSHHPLISCYYQHLHHHHHLFTNYLALTEWWCLVIIPAHYNKTHHCTAVLIV